MITCLPPELNSYILDFLDIGDLLQVAQVSRAYQTLVDDEKRWKSIAQSLQFCPHSNLSSKKIVLLGLQELIRQINGVFNLTLFKEPDPYAALKNFLVNSSTLPHLSPNFWVVKAFQKGTFLKQLVGLNNSHALALMRKIDPASSQSINAQLKRLQK